MAFDGVIEALVDRETRAWDNQDAETLVDLFHPDMFWAWPPDADAHDPMTWEIPFGRYDRERWRDLWQGLFDSCELVHNKRITRRAELTEQGDGGFAVVDIDTFWRDRKTGEEMRWKGRVSKGYTKTEDGWKLITHSGVLNYD